MRRIEGVCREYLPNTDNCMLNLNECDAEENEECVPSPIAPANRVKHGTCQCQLGFKRDLDSFKCIDITESSSDNNDKSSKDKKVSILKRNDFDQKYTKILHKSNLI